MVSLALRDRREYLRPGPFGSPDCDPIFLMKYLRRAGILIGLLLVVLLVHKVGWDTIGETLALLKWKYLIVLAYPLTWMVLNTLGWRWACSSGSVQIPLRKWVEIRLA